MFERNSSSTERYKLNKHTVLTVKNTACEGEAGEKYYRSEITLKHKTTSDSPLIFTDPDNIADFVCNIDLTNDQLALPGIADETRKDLN